MVGGTGACPMIICAAGDIHGAIDRFYTDVLEFEAALELRFHHML